ncbi:MAG TPA: DUF4397 domain-containing protein [Streptosporangiaceae bacterium]|jgi:hypothetical protein|nr:DUF4397 domain-containing protein [Streptosporangiaceae bacterium]
MRSLFRLALIAGAALTSCLAPPTVAAAPAGTSALIRGAHLSPDTVNVDVYLTAFSGGTTTFWLSNVGYGDVSPYSRIAPGPYAVSMRPHGAAASTPPALSWRLTVLGGHAYTVAGVGVNKQLRGVVLQDQLTPPPAGHGLVRVIQASSWAGHANVTAGGTVLAQDIAFATAGQYVSVPAGTLTVHAKSDTAPSFATSASVPVRSGSVSSVVLLDGKGRRITIRTLTDAAGAAAMPIGAVPAGGGGTASRPDAGLPVARVIAAVGGAFLGLAGLVGLARARRRPATR